jgi:hypothetical protein
MLATASGVTAAYMGLSKPFGILVLLAVAAPFILFDVLSPPALDLLGDRTCLEFEFRDPHYAEEFARVNGVQPDEI